MVTTIRHHGWESSPYSAKTRAYLRYKEIEFDDHTPTLLELQTRVRRRVGRIIMPTLEMPDGRWLQDSSEIIDTLEAQYPEPSVIPSTPKQGFIAYLLELFGDEWLIVAAMHTRWNDPTNRAFVIDDFGRSGVPLLPKRARRFFGSQVGKRMSAYLPRMGITPTTTPGVDAMLESFLTALDGHLRTYRYLLGSRPCIGDFAIMAPLYAHVSRDPGSRHRLVPFTHVRNWVQRMHDGARPEGGFLPNDEIPESLHAVLQPVFEETLPYGRSVVNAINRWCDGHPDAQRTPRALGDTDFVIGGCHGKRRLITYNQWMLQRPLFYLQNLSPEARATIDPLLHALNAATLVESIDIRYPTKRLGFREVLSK